MWKTLITLIFVLQVCSCTYDPDQFIISGTIAGAAVDYIYLSEMTAGGLVTVDSAKLADDGHFQLTGITDMIRFYALQLAPKRSITLLVQPRDRIEINANVNELNNYAVSGSVDSEKIRQLTARLNNTVQQIFELSKIFNDSSESPNFLSIKNDLDLRYEEIITSQKEYTYQFIKNNINSLASLMALYQQVDPRRGLLDPYEDFSYFNMVDSSLSIAYPKAESVKELHRQVTEILAQQNYFRQSEKHLAIGALAPEIALPDPDGDTILLSSLKGNIVLLDFWASWCPPCRKENPNLVRLYKEFAPKGFRIYQVSLDKTKAAWLRGIEEDKLDWINVSDLRMWESIVVSVYGLQGIPVNFLLDQEGRIIDKNLYGKMLEDKLKEVFKKS